jgi:FkbH-like protein
MTETTEQTIAIAATFTAELIEEPLVYWMQELGIPSKIEFAPYNQVFQELLNPSSLLLKNDDGINTVLIRLEDWHKSSDNLITNAAFTVQEKEEIERNTQDFVQALKSAAERFGLLWIVCICPASSIITEDKDSTEFFRMMEARIVSELSNIRGVYLVTASDLNTLYPVSKYDDPFSDKTGHIPFTPEFFTSLATMIARRIFAIRSKPYKVIVLDCDQTLWKGICGEDGVDGVEIDVPHRALQEFMIDQYKVGMLLCLCSKNNEEDVADVFERHPGMCLRMDLIVSRRINWKSKPENIKSLAEELQVGLDSFIFIDDEPIECARVQAECPDVLTVRLPQEPNDIPRFLNHVWAFDHLEVTAEDKKRTRFYKQQAERNRFQEESLTFGDFLEGLELNVQISKMSDSQISRVAQLTQRTNQFNFTTIRRSEGDIQKLHQSKKLECLGVEVSDRFGDYGLVGVMIFRTNVNALQVDTFLLSCRVLGRGVEHRMLAKLGEIAKEQGLNDINIPFVPTLKNQPAFDFLQRITAKPEKQINSQMMFSLPVEHAVTLTYDSAISKVDSQKAGKKESPDISMAQESQLISRLLEKIATELYDVEHILKDMESRKYYSKRSMLKKVYVPPHTPIEQMLTDIWTKVLHVDKIGIYDNFFELGGHSLLATQVMSRVHDLFDVELSMKRFFDTPTVAGVSGAIIESKIEESGSGEISVMLNELDDLSDDEIKILLSEERDGS